VITGADSVAGMPAPSRPNVLVVMTDEERYPPQRTNLAADPPSVSVRAQLETVLERTREEVRRTPQHVNAPV
jgi:hypothetical protein